MALTTSPPQIVAPGRARPAVFLDKDGTLIEDVPYNVDPDRLRFTPRALPALELLHDAGYAIVIVTNQPGLATGRFTRADFARLEAALIDLVHAGTGVQIAAVEACPHAPGADGRPACLCRKPAPGLIKRAALKHRLDLSQSWMVGDILDDIEAGRRAGCRTVLLDTGHETVWRTSPLRMPHHRATDLFEAAQTMLAEGRREVRPPSTAWTPRRPSRLVAAEWR